jgi:ribosomal protein L17
MVELKSFDSFLNEAVSPEEEKDLLQKGHQVSSIVNEIIAHQKEITDLYDKLKDLMKDNEILAPLAKSVKLAADRSKEDSIDAKEIGQKIEKTEKEYKPKENSPAPKETNADENPEGYKNWERKTKKEYVPTPGSAAEYLLDYLEDARETTEHKAQEHMRLVRKPNRYGPNGYGFNRGTVTSTLEFLVDRGVLDKVSKLNPESKRTAWFYILKNKS